MSIGDSTVHDLRQMLMGQRWVGIGRAAEMAVVSFGGQEVVRQAHGVAVQYSPYALHIQCAFRLVHGDSVFLGIEDMLRPLAGRLREKYLSMHRDPEDPTLFDARARGLETLIKQEELVVTDCTASPRGDLYVYISQGFEINVIPMSSYKKESWRVLHRGAAHIVYPASVDLPPQMGTA